MQRYMAEACRQAFQILKRGAVQTTDSFYNCLPRKADDKPWSHKQRMSLMLRYLRDDLIERESEYRLVRLSRQGESGLYQMVSKDDPLANEQPIDPNENPYV